MARKKTEINYKDYFIFPDIPDTIYPVYAISESGKVCNFKSIIYPTPKSAKKFTRRKQLTHRSLLAKIFDAIINIGYFYPLIVYKEFPVVILNHLRLPGLDGMYYMADYAFPELRLFVELDTPETHNPKKDKIRDEYLKKLGITVFRINNLEKPDVLKREFPKLAALMRLIGKLPPIKFDFFQELRILKKI